MLEETEARVQEIYDIAMKHAPDYEVEKILAELRGEDSDGEEIRD